MSETKVSRILTRETVEANNPCYEYSQRFFERFPESVEVTVELAVSQAEDWDWYWAANALLGYTGRAAWNKLDNEADEAYNTVVGPYQDAMGKVCEEFEQVYNRVLREDRELGPSWGGRHQRAVRAAEPVVEIERAALDAVRVVAQKRLNKARAKAWAEIYISETDEPTFVGGPAQDDGACGCWSCRHNGEEDW